MPKRQGEPEIPSSGTKYALPSHRYCVSTAGQRFHLRHNHCPAGDARIAERGGRASFMWSLLSIPSRTKSLVGVFRVHPKQISFSPRQIALQSPAGQCLAETINGLCLAGVAPMTRQSGQWRVKPFTQGGRKFLRVALHMPVLVAARHNPDFARKYQSMRAAGKPAKLALTALMRRLIELANALIKADRKWSPNSP